MATPRAKKKATPKKAPRERAVVDADDEVDATADLLAEALGRRPVGNPSPTQPPPASMPKQPTGTDPDEFPLTARAGGHDLNAENWADRSKRMAAMARQNEVRAIASTTAPLSFSVLAHRAHSVCSRIVRVVYVQVAELEAKLRLGMLTKREQQKLGPSLLAKAEAEAAAQHNAQLSSAHAT